MFRTFIISVFFLLCCQGYVFSANNPADKLDELSQKIARNNEKLRQKTDLKEKTQHDINRLNRALRLAELRQRQTEKKLDSAKTKLQSSKAKYVQMEKEYSDLQEETVQRLVKMYKHETIDFWETLLFPETRDSVFDSVILEKIMASDIDRLKRLKKMYTALSKERARLRSRAEEIEKLNREVTLRKRKITSQKEQKEAYASVIERQIEDLERQNKAFEDSYESLAQQMTSKDVAGKYLGTGKFIKPVKGWISSKFGRRWHPVLKRWAVHRGLDVAAPSGYRIHAADSGIVIFAGQKPEYWAYGKVTVINHGRRESDGKQICTLYAHQSRILVKEGDYVAKGTEIGWVGTTGRSTGPHLHFEVWENRVRVDPMPYLKGQK